MAGAPQGNQNRNKAQLWDLAVERVLEKRGITRLEALGEVFEALHRAAKGSDISAVREYLDRELGKVKQAIEHSGDPEAPVQVSLVTPEQLEEKIRGLVTSARVIQEVEGDRG